MKKDEPVKWVGKAINRKSGSDWRQVSLGRDLNNPDNKDVYSIQFVHLVITASGETETKTFLLITRESLLALRQLIDDPDLEV